MELLVKFYQHDPFFECGLSLRLLEGLIFRPLCIKIPHKQPWPTCDQQIGKVQGDSRADPKLEMGKVDDLLNTEIICIIIIAVKLNFNSSI